MTQENETNPTESKGLVEAVNYILDAANKLKDKLMDAVEHVQDTKKDVGTLCAAVGDIIDIIHNLCESADGIDVQKMQIIAGLPDTVYRILTSLNKITSMLSSVNEGVNLGGLEEVRETLKYRAYLQNDICKYVADMLTNSTLDEVSDNEEFLKKIIKSRDMLMATQRELNSFSSIPQVGVDVIIEAVSEIIESVNAIAYSMSASSLVIALLGIKIWTRILPSLEPLLKSIVDLTKKSDVDLSKLEMLSNAIKRIPEIFEVILKTNAVEVTLKLHMMVDMVEELKPLIKSLERITDTTNVDFDKLERIVNSIILITDVFDAIKEVQVLKTFIKIKLSTLVVEELIPLIQSISAMTNRAEIDSAKLKVINQSVKSVIELLINIRDMKLTHVVVRLLELGLAIYCLEWVVKSISQLVNREAPDGTKLKYLSSLIKDTSDLFDVVLKIKTIKAIGNLELLLVAVDALGTVLKHIFRLAELGAEDSKLDRITQNVHGISYIFNEINKLEMASTLISLKLMDYSIGTLEDVLNHTFKMAELGAEDSKLDRITQNVHGISYIFEEVCKIDSMKGLINLMLLKFSINILREVLEKTVDMAEEGAENSKLDKVIQNAQGIAYIFEEIGRIKSAKTLINTKLLKLALGSLREILNQLNELVDLNDLTEKRMIEAEIILRMIPDLFKNLGVIKGPKDLLRIRLLAYAMSDMNMLMDELVKLTNRDNIKIDRLIELTEALAYIPVMFDIIRKTDTKFISFKIKVVTAAVDKMDPLITGMLKLADHNGVKKGARKMRYICAMVKSFADLMVALILLAPLAAMFLMLSPIILLMVAAVSLVVAVIVKVISFTVNVKTAAAIVGLILILGLIAWLAVGLIAIAVLARDAIRGLPSVIGLMIGLVVFVVAFAAFGAIMSAMSAMMMPAVLGLAVVGIAVLSLLAIAAALYLISAIDLDIEAIKDKVSQILGAVSSLTAWVFSPVEEPDETGEKPDRGVLDLFGAGFVKLIGSLLASGTLFMAVMSVGSILLIAGMLRLLQTINLNADEIQENVNIVIGLCRSIVKTLFAPDEENKDASDRGIMQSLLKMIEDNELTKVLEAVFSMAYLAVMVIAVGAILAMAGMLRGLQEINLDEKTIRDNVSTVINTCRSIIAEIFAPDEDNKDTSDRGVMATLMSWVSDNELTKVLEAVFSMAYLAVMFIAVVALLGVAKTLEQIAELKPEVFEAARSNIESMMSLMAYLRSCVFAPDTEESTRSGRGALMSIVAWVAGEGTAKTLEGILMIGYLATMYLTVFLLAGLAKSIQYIADMNMEKIGTAKTNAETIMETAVGLMNTLVNGNYDLPKAKDSGILKKLVTAFLPDDLVAVADALATVGKLAVMQVSVGAVARLAKEIQTLANIHFGKNVDKNVDTILTTSKNITTKMMNNFGVMDADDLSNIEPVIKQVEKSVKRINDLANTLNKLSEVKITGITGAETVAKEVFKHARAIVASIVGNTKATEEATWQTIIDSKDELINTSSTLRSSVNPVLVDMGATMDQAHKLATNITKIGSVSDAQITAASNITQKSVDSVHDLISHGLMTNGVEDTLEVLNQRKMEVAQLGEMVTHGSDAMSQLSDMINTHFQNSNLNEDIITAKATAYKTSLNEFRQILEMADSMEPDANRVNTNADLMDRIAKTIGHFVKVTDSDVSNSRRITENYGKFLATVDKMDYQKLNATAWMMKHWASISRDLRGDFEGLARSVNENVMPMLDKLNKTMAEVTKCQQEIINDLTQPVSLYFPGSEMPTNSLPDFNTTTPTPTSTAPVGGGDTPDGSTSAAGDKTSTPKASTPFSLPRPQYNGPFATQTTTRPRSTKLNSLVPELGKKYTVEFSKIEEA